MASSPGRRRASKRPRRKCRRLKNKDRHRDQLGPYRHRGGLPPVNHFLKEKSI
jgi:hypothetical protein